MIVPPHYRYPRTQGSVAHANKPTPEREHASKQASKPGQGRRGKPRPTTPKRAHTSKNANTHANTPRKRKHQTPPPASKHAHTSLLFHHPREHKKRPRHSAWASKMCERGNPWQQGRPARTKRRHTTRARRTSTHKSAQTTPVCARCAACARQTGVRRERKAAHNSPRQSAWVVVFVGVFADVCRLFEAGRLGGWGVFLGCLACFLVF